MKLSISRALPSLFTVSAFMCGFNAINIASSGGNIKYSIILVILAAILDLFDGRVARLLGTDSKFGAELDSLSDLVCFGVAASFIVLHFYDAHNKLLVIACCFLSICTMLRLARFNLDIQYPPYYKNFFVGVPAPAGFVLAILPICIHYAFHIDINIYFYTCYTFVVAYLMVSTIPTPSTKGLSIKKTNIPALIALLSLIVIALMMYTWIVFSLLGILYIISIIFSVLVFLRKKSSYKTQ